MSASQRFDCLVIGGGCNGLIAAAYLAKAGKTVAVLERRSQFGGGAAGVPMDGAAGAALDASETPPRPARRYAGVAGGPAPLPLAIAHDLQLRQFGVQWRTGASETFTPLLDGRWLALGGDERRNRQELSRFSKADAAAYPKFQRLVRRTARALAPAFARPAPDSLPLPKDRRKISVSKRLRDVGKLVELYRAAGELGDDLPDALQLLTGSLRGVLESWFESEVVRATLAAGAIGGQFTSLTSAGTALPLVEQALASDDGADAGGGSGGAEDRFVTVDGGELAEALTNVCRKSHVTLAPNCEVVRIVVEDGRVRGVALADGRLWQSDAVVSSVDLRTTALGMLAPGELPDYFRRSIQQVVPAGSLFRVDLALSEPPAWRGAPTGLATSPHGKVVVASTLDSLERAWDDAKYGWPSTEPVLELTSLGDPTSLSITARYAPYRLADGKSWDDVKEDFADRCVESATRFAPNLKAAIVERRALSPVDLERAYGWSAGDRHQGATAPGQFYSLRPVAGWSDGRTPIAGLYLCGAGVHPGGGVLGVQGRNAAEEVVRDE